MKFTWTRKYRRHDVNRTRQARRWKFEDEKVYASMWFQSNREEEEAQREQ